MDDAEDKGFDRLLEQLRQSRGFDFSVYKRPSLMRRVARRMQTLEIESYETYGDFLEVHQEEFEHLFNTILINVTSFFRDPEAWEVITEQVVPEILAAKSTDGSIRVWSAGCASGEEAFTLAIIFCEKMGTTDFCNRVKIYATDADEHALVEARTASYRADALEAVDPALVEKYFEKIGDRYLLDKDLRRCVIFGKHDLVQDAPISKIDLLTCRNVLIYLNAEAQARIASRFHFALKPHGCLFLGKAETLLAHSSLFKPVDLKRRIFAKVPQMRFDRKASESPSNRDQLSKPHAAPIIERAFDSSPTAQVIVDADDSLLLVNECARNMFGL
ncbi:MAG TPA: CheR family methyltransferase, partial [Fimbriimonadaceae bacterium]|nr:CheR family methyltransferase [Fimbriimonadaceae bacterium]